MEAAANWIIEHEDDADIDQMPLVCFLAHSLTHLGHVLKDVKGNNALCFLGAMIYQYCYYEVQCTPPCLTFLYGYVCLGVCQEQS